MKRINYRQLHPELLSTASLNFSAAEDSSSRQEMIGSHLSQSLVIDGASTRRCQSGMERKFGEATFKIKLPCNAEIKALVEKYPESYGYDSINFNPLTTVIYEDIEKGVIDVIDMPYYNCKHSKYGFRYKVTEAGATLSAKGMNSSLRKGTVLADSPNIDTHGNYNYGVDVNICFMSIPGAIEDGIIVGRSMLKKMVSTGYGKRHGSWGKHEFPLNLYGDEEHFKAFPDIGEKVRGDGLLFAFRQRDDLLGGVTMAKDQLCKVDHIFDNRVYAEPNAKVIDVNTRQGTNYSCYKTPEGMGEQPNKYYQHQRDYYTKIDQTVHDIQKRNKVVVAPKLHRLLVEGHVFKAELGKHKPKLMYNLEEIDEWRVDLEFEYKVEPNIGSKASSIHGELI